MKQIVDKQIMKQGKLSRTVDAFEISLSPSSVRNDYFMPPHVFFNNVLADAEWLFV